MCSQICKVIQSPSIYITILERQDRVWSPWFGHHFDAAHLCWRWFDSSVISPRPAMVEGLASQGTNASLQALVMGCSHWRWLADGLFTKPSPKGWKSQGLQRAWPLMMRWLICFGQSLARICRLSRLSWRSLFFPRKLDNFRSRPIAVWRAHVEIISCVPLQSSDSCFCKTSSHN